MQKLNLGCYGMVITHSEEAKNGATIVSELKSDLNDADEAFNCGVDTIESLVLAHFCAGINVTSPEYLEGIEAACNALANNIDDVEVDESIVTIEKSLRVNAIVDQTINYEVDKEVWEKALSEFGGESIALFELQKADKVEVVFNESSVDEVNTTFDESVIEI